MTMTKLFLSAFLLVAATAGCGDDTTSSSGNGGAGGDDLVVTVAGAGGHAAGCEPGEQLSCRCADGASGTSTCVTNQAGETIFSNCEC